MGLNCAFPENPQLRNGARGSIIEIFPDGTLLVKFDNVEENTHVKPHRVSESIKDNAGRDIASVTAVLLPIYPGFAVTVHRSQATLTLTQILATSVRVRLTPDGQGRDEGQGHIGLRGDGSHQMCFQGDEVNHLHVDFGGMFLNGQA